MCVLKLPLLNRQCSSRALLMLLQWLRFAGVCVSESGTAKSSMFFMDSVSSFKLILKPQALNPKLHNRWSKLLQEKGVIALKNPKPTSFRGASWRCSAFDLLIPLRVVGSTKLHREPEALRALPKLNKQPDN